MDQVLVNPESGLAELHEPEAASELLMRGYHLPLHDAEGNSFSAPHSQASELIHSGQYRQPSPQELGQWLEHARYNSPSQKAMAFVEGAARGIAGPLAPDLEQEFLGVPKEEQLKRKDYSPGTALTGELGTIAGLTAMSSGFFGAAKAGRLAELAETLPALPNIIQKAGQAASAGIRAEGAFGRMAQAATAGAIESAIYTAQNKLTEATLGDPSALSEHMIADMGVSALIGGGLGGALSAATIPLSHISRKLEKLEGYLQSKIPAEGKVGYSAAPDLVSLAADPAAQFKSAINIPDKQGWLDKFKGLMPDLGVADIVALAKNAHGIGAYHALKLAAKLTPEKLVDIFADQAPKALPLVEALKTGLSSLSKVEHRAASLFGYGASRALERPESSGKLHDLNDESLKIEAAPRILIENLQKHTEPIADYMPDTTIALAQNLQKAVQLLSEARPNLNKRAPLDGNHVPTQMQKINFNNTANIINDPLSAMNHIKHGTLTQEHMRVLQTLYPNMLVNMQKQVMKNLIQYQSENRAPLPYKMRIGLSRLLGQPLDSSLTGIAQNQAAFASVNQAKANSMAGMMRPSKVGIGKMKSAEMDQTPAQRAQERRMGQS